MPWGVYKRVGHGRAGGLVVANGSGAGILVDNGRLALLACHQPDAVTWICRSCVSIPGHLYEWRRWRLLRRADFSARRVSHVRRGRLPRAVARGCVAPRETGSLPAPQKTAWRDTTHTVLCCTMCNPLRTLARFMPSLPYKHCGPLFPFMLFLDHLNGCLTACPMLPL